jgi:hypothetical protein
LKLVLCAALPAFLYVYVQSRLDDLHEVEIGDAEVGLTGTLTLSDVRVGDRIAADRVEVSADEIVVDRPRVEARLEGGTLDVARLLRRGGDGGGRRRRIVIRDGEVALDLGRYGALHARDVEILPEARGARIVVGPVAADLGAGGYRAAARFARAGFDVELPGARLGRAALDGGEVTLTAAGATPLALTDVVVVRGRETRLSGRLPGGGAVAVTLGATALVEADGLPLAPLLPLLPPWLLPEGSAAGTARVRLDGARVEVAADLRLHGVAVAHPILARVPLPLDGGLAARVAWDRRARTGGGTLRWTAGALAIDADLDVALGAGDSVRRAALTARLPTLPCAAALAALPAPLHDRLEGLDLAGDLGGRADIGFDRDRPDDARLAVDLDVRCRVVRDDSGAAVELLAGPYVHRLPGGGERVLDPSDPDFVALAALPPWVPAAFVAAEDARFFAHHGFDGEQLLRSFTIDVAAGKIERGGSTISQQLVKNLYLGPERTLARKLLEAVLTWRLEQAVAKPRILEAYLNVIELGAGVHGVGPGARRWFGKPATRLTPAEAAFLAAVTAAPATNEARLAATGRLDPATVHRAEIILGGMRRTIHSDGVHAALEALAKLRPATI